MLILMWSHIHIWKEYAKLTRKNIVFVKSELFILMLLQFQSSKQIGFSAQTNPLLPTMGIWWMMYNNVSIQRYIIRSCIDFWLSNNLVILYHHHHYAKEQMITSFLIAISCSWSIYNHGQFNFLAYLYCNTCQLYHAYNWNQK